MSYAVSHSLNNVALISKGRVSLKLAAVELIMICGATLSQSSIPTTFTLPPPVSLATVSAFAFVLLVRCSDAIPEAISGAITPLAAPPAPISKM